jgi:hypothetical protein
VGGGRKGWGGNVRRAKVLEGRLIGKHVRRKGREEGRTNDVVSDVVELEPLEHLAVAEGR